MADRRRKKLYCVIMAGGKGTRFWPLSRKAKPKQLLHIFGNSSMLQITVDRLRKLSFVEEIFIVTGPDLEDAIKNDIEGIPPENIIVEPSGKNTAPCIGLAALHIIHKDENAVMGVFPSDHLIVGHRQFSKVLTAAIHQVNTSGCLATIGVVPTSPKTGYGYIQFINKPLQTIREVYTVKTFAEKPTINVAKRFLKSGEFLWNSGMFVWKVSTILSSFEKMMPDLYEPLRVIGDSIGKRTYKSILQIEWDNIKPESVDYGILERADNIIVVKAKFRWSDVGSWNTYYEISTKNRDGNVIKGKAVVLDGSNNLIYSEGKYTALIGMENLVVINTDDATLIVPRDRVEEVKDIVLKFQKTGNTEIL